MIAILNLLSACATMSRFAEKSLHSNYVCFHSLVFFFVCFFLSFKSKPIISDGFDLTVLPVLLRPQSSPYDCLRSIMFCGVNLLTCVSSGT